ncbi:MAG: ATP-binding cassette domain-containing protein [Candidatus Manganitrophus sp.]|nr:ATP-binding cassette domain-containing protein [Candidatus Manganitrophus sp.]
MLEVQGLNVSYGDSQVLRGVHLNIPAGKVVCLMGRNGVGKTTLMKTIIGLLAPKGGRITLAGEEITKAPPYLRARRGIGYVPQGREIIPSLTVEENLLIGLEASGGKTIPAEVFDLFPVLKTMLGRRGGDLTGGQQQQLAIGRALVSGPQLLILDEPTEGIQPSIIKEIVARDPPDQGGGQDGDSAGGAVPFAGSGDCRFVLRDGEGGDCGGRAG